MLIIWIYISRANTPLHKVASTFLLLLMTFRVLVLATCQWSDNLEEDFCKTDRHMVLKCERSWQQKTKAEQKCLKTMNPKLHPNVDCFSAFKIRRDSQFDSVQCSLCNTEDNTGISPLPPFTVLSQVKVDCTELDYSVLHYTDKQN